MLDRKTKQFLNDAYSEELYASHLYKHVSAQVKRLGWDGLASYFIGESKEDANHAASIAAYVDGRADTISSPSIESIEIDILSFRDAIEAALEAEQSLERKYADWYAACDCQVTKQFLLGFIEIQRVSVERYAGIVATLDTTKDDVSVLLHIQSKLAKG
jgi:ferritin